MAALVAIAIAFGADFNIVSIVALLSFARQGVSAPGWPPETMRNFIGRPGGC